MHARRSRGMHVDHEPLTRNEVAIVALWTESGLAMQGERAQPWAVRIMAKLRGLYTRGKIVADDDAPDGYRLPEHQIPHNVSIGERATLERRAALAACEAASAMGASNVAIVSGDVVIATMPDGTQRTVYDPDILNSKPKSSEPATATEPKSKPRASGRKK